MSFPVIYKGREYLVDPNALSTASQAFRDLLQPYVSNNTVSNAKLIIADEDFTERNIENFLKLCQNQPTDVQDSEMKQICQIARMFRADGIYNTGIEFIHSKIDSSYNVSLDQYSPSTGNRYMYIEQKQSTPTQPPNQSDDTSLVVESNAETGVPLDKDQVIYELWVINPLVKLNRYYFVENGDIIESAKQKNNEIYLARGPEVHVSKDVSNRIGKIILNQNQTNTIKINDEVTQLNYVFLPETDRLSVSFNIEYFGENEKWSPVDENLCSKHYSSAKLTGESERSCIKSKKNTVLQNEKGELRFIVRKFEEYKYEVECDLGLDTTFAFAVALSQILGPMQK